VIDHTLDSPGSGGELASHPGEDLVAALGEDGVAAVYNVSTGVPVWRSATGLSCVPTQSALQFSADGTRLFAGCVEGLHTAKQKATIKSWDVKTGRILTASPIPEGIVSPAHFSSDARWWVGMRKAVQSEARTPYVYSVIETESGRELASVRGIVLAVSASKGHVLLSSDDGAQLVNVQDGSRSLLAPHARVVPTYISAAISPNGLHAVFSGYRTVIVDLTTHKVNDLTGDPVPLSYGVAIAPDNEQFALAQGDALLLFSISDPTKRRTIGTQAAVMMSAEAAIAALAAEDEERSTTTRKLDEVAQEYSKKIAAANKRDRKRLQDEFTRKLAELRTQSEQAERTPPAVKVPAELMKFGAAPAFIPAVAFIEAGRLLAVRAADGLWDVWDVATGNRLPFRQPPADIAKYVEGPPEAVLDGTELTALAASVAGTSRAAQPAAPSPPGATACESENGEYVVRITREQGRITRALLLSLAGGTPIDLLATDIRLPNPVVPGEFRLAREGSWMQKVSGGERLCAVSPDGARIIVDEPQPAKSISSASGGAAGRSNSHDYWGRKLTADGLTVYDTKTGRKVCSLEPEAGQNGFNVGAGELQFSPTGRLIIGGGAVSTYAGKVRRSIHLWDAATCKRMKGLAEPAGAPLGFSRDDQQYFTTLDQPADHDVYGARVFDTASSEPQYQIPDVQAARRLLVAQGAVLIGPDRERTIGIWDRRSGERLGTFRPLQEGEWLVTTPSGLFDGSPRAWSAVAWRDQPGDLSTKPAEVFFNEFYRPGLLAELMEGGRPAVRRNLGNVDRRQPVVTIRSQASVTVERTATLHLMVEEIPQSGAYADSSGARDLRIFRNGSLVKVWRGALALTSGRAHFEVKVPLVAGENRFIAYAFNRDNVKSADAATVVQCTAPKRPGTVYLLSIGVNRYANPEFNLRFAVPDAEQMAAMLARSQGQLGYKKVVSVMLADNQATKANIILALSRLAGRERNEMSGAAPKQLGQLLSAEPEDTVIVYFAGHGTARGDRFYLIPHDLGYTGPREGLHESMERVLEAGISDLDLERAFEPIDAAHLMLIIDACDSGKALDSEDERRGPMNSKGLAQLSYEKGMYVLTAAQAYQAALETERLGHGYLTYALVEEALSSPSADTRPADSEVTAVEWFEYAARRVPQLQIEALKDAASKGRALIFEAAVVRGRPQNSWLQTPRFYYRRDDSGPPLIISRLK
jgi:WD40 repeat protein